MTPSPFSALFLPSSPQSATPSAADDLLNSPRAHSSPRSFPPHCRDDGGGATPPAPATFSTTAAERLLAHRQASAASLSPPSSPAARADAAHAADERLARSLLQQAREECTSLEAERAVLRRRCTALELENESGRAELAEALRQADRWRAEAEEATEAAAAAPAPTAAATAAAAAAAAALRDGEARVQARVAGLRGAADAAAATLAEGAAVLDERRAAAAAGEDEAARRVLAAEVRRLSGENAALRLRQAQQQQPAAAAGSAGVSASSPRLAVAAPDAFVVLERERLERRVTFLERQLDAVAREAGAASAARSERAWSEGGAGVLHGLAVHPGKVEGGGGGGGGGGCGLTMLAAGASLRGSVASSSTFGLGVHDLEEEPEESCR